MNKTKILKYKKDNRNINSPLEYHTSMYCRQKLLMNIHLKHTKHEGEMQNWQCAKISLRIVTEKKITTFK